jgi:peptidoglycan/LPS O-acetylase OafA/YrhL
MHWYHVVAASLYVANMDLLRPWIFGHLWSLSMEEQFYLLWPFAIKKWHRHKTAILLCVFLYLLPHLSPSRWVIAFGADGLRLSLQF